MWLDGQCTQTLIHPAQSVWAVAVLGNGDIATGCNDGVIRIFTRSSERVAEHVVQEAYDAEVSKSTVSSNQVGDVDKSKLPGPERLLSPGSKDAQV